MLGAASFWARPRVTAVPNGPSREDLIDFPPRPLPPNPHLSLFLKQLQDGRRSAGQEGHDHRHGADRRDQVCRSGCVLSVLLPQPPPMSTLAKLTHATLPLFASQASPSRSFSVPSRSSHPSLMPCTGDFSQWKEGGGPKRLGLGFPPSTAAPLSRDEGEASASDTPSFSFASTGPSVTSDLLSTRRSTCTSFSAFAVCPILSGGADHLALRTLSDNPPLPPSPSPTHLRLPRTTASRMSSSSPLSPTRRPGFLLGLRQLVCPTGLPRLSRSPSGSKFSTSQSLGRKRQILTFCSLFSTYWFWNGLAATGIWIIAHGTLPLFGRDLTIRLM